ncbi:iron(III) transport system ATP-binding protein [Nitrosomonas sp. PY1]|uniref:ABC transporter ATP-binding protein n=1 Tax=Nitrosomonas sp. PY1 TaxID=1803906 RepID=UPI001FC84A1E|nr:ABC transporter ATP-binding protein [Nitrosomonas sp. PY1]GKS68479.1 iron(III) transport system ATP-binding protein [Nitrosomonas sp. PY1]
MISHPFLQLDTIQQAYGKRIVVDTLTLTLEQGTIGCLLGPSGCGKTTVLRCIAGFERITAGEIRLDDILLCSALHFVPPEQRNIGMVFQDYALFPHLNVADNIRFGLNHLSKIEKQQRVHELLDIMHLADSINKFPHELSGGQQQRVALARALAPRPKLLLLDEPFSNLDVNLRERLSMEVRDILKQQHITAILVTHDQAEAFAIADQIGVMYQGAIQQWDTADNLYHHPINRFVAHFIGQGTLLPGIMRDSDHVETELGVLSTVLTSQKTNTNSHDVDVFLRPSDIEFDENSRAYATITHKIFLGAEILYTIRLDSGITLLLLSSSHVSRTIGNRTGIKLRPHHSERAIAFSRP